jgi:hypothetical protein
MDQVGVKDMVMVLRNLGTEMVIGYAQIQGVEM